MSNFIPKPIIDKAAQLRLQGLTWQDIGEIIYQQGMVDINGNKYHNKLLCIKVLRDPQWAHLRENKLFSVNKINILKQAMIDSGATDSMIQDVIKRLG